MNETGLGQMFFLYCRDSFQSVALKFNGFGFVYLMNIYCLLFGTGVRFSYNTETQEYIFQDIYSEDEVVFLQRERAFLYYVGIKKRIDWLSRVYHLNSVPFEDGDIVFDCGANIGELFYWFKYKNFDLDYVGFEPSPNEFACLKKNVSPSVVHNIGLWNQDDELNFYISSEGADSSFIEPENYSNIIKVKSNKLEIFLSKPIKFLKIDAEGGELEVLKGIGEKIIMIEYISADLGFERGSGIKRGTLCPVVNFLTRKGFSLVGISSARLVVLFINNRFMSLDNG